MASGVYSPHAVASLPPHLPLRTFRCTCLCAPRPQPAVGKWAQHNPCAHPFLELRPAPRRGNPPRHRGRVPVPLVFLLLRFLHLRLRLAAVPATRAPGAGAAPALDSPVSPACHTLRGRVDVGRVGVGTGGTGGCSGCVACGVVVPRQPGSRVAAHTSTPPLSSRFRLPHPDTQPSSAKVVTVLCRQLTSLDLPPHPCRVWARPGHRRPGATLPPEAASSFPGWRVRRRWRRNTPGDGASSGLCAGSTPGCNSFASRPRSGALV